MMSEKPILAWHFGQKRLGFADGRQVRIGARQRFRPANGHTTLMMCDCGMHGSVDILDALCYARGPIVRRVELSGQIITDTDKMCAEYRKALWAVDTTSLLRRFACQCALDVIHLWDAPEVVIRYLKTQDEQLRVAYAAATSASASASAAAAASASASAAVAAAAYAAATSASAAAYAAAYAAARTRQQRRLLRLVHNARKK